MTHAAWMEQAESDLDAARVLRDAGLHSQAIWLAAQAVEKGHKAILVALGLQYEERHFKYLGHSIAEISKLLPDPLHEPRDAGIASTLARLEARARDSRYPSPAQRGSARPQIVAPASRFGPSDAEAEVRAAEQMLSWCRERVRRALHAKQAMSPDSGAEDDQ